MEARDPQDVQLALQSIARVCYSSLAERQLAVEVLSKRCMLGRNTQDQVFFGGRKLRLSYKKRENYAYTGVVGADLSIWKTRMGI